MRLICLLFYFTMLSWTTTGQNQYEFELEQEMAELKVLPNFCVPDTLHDILSNLTMPLDEGDLDKFEKALLEEVSLCNSPVEAALERTIYCNTNISRYSNASAYQQKLEILESLKVMYTPLEAYTSSDSSQLALIQLYEGAFYADSENYIKAKNSYYKAAEFIEKNPYPTLVYGLFSDIKLNASPSVRDVIMDCMANFKKEKNKPNGTFWYNRCLLLASKYYAINGIQDSSLHFLNKIDQDFINRYPSYVHLARSFHHNSFNNKAAELNSLEMYYQAKKSKLNDGKPIDALILQGEYHLEQLNYEEAYNYFEEAFKANQSDLPELDLVQNESYHIKCLLGMAEIKLRQNDITARELIDEAIILISGKFSKMNFQEEKIKLLENYSKMFSLLIKHRKQLKLSSNQLLEFSEKARAYTLLDEINQLNAIKSQLTVEDFDIFQRNKYDIANLQKQIKAHSAKKAISNSEKQERLDSIRSLINQKNKLQSSVDLTQSAVEKSDQNIEVNEQLLQPNRDYSIIEYFIEDSMSLAFLINENDIQLYELDLGSEAKEQIKKFKKLLISKDPKAKEEFNALSRRLFQSLLSKFYPQLNRKIIVIPHGIISEVPFEALMNGDKYLVEDHDISYSYSIKVLEEMRAKSGGKNKFIGLAPSYSTAFNPLPNNDDELYAVSSEFQNVELLIGEDASKSNFLNSISDFNIIHIAAHADINPEDNDLSYVAFSDKQNAKQGNRLFLPELYNIDLNANMIVLSACNTGIGLYQKGEGILSLARGFVYAGTASVLSSLWQANDQYTLQLMRSFYAHLAKGKNKDFALAEAKRDYLATVNKSLQHPYYWAGFILIGDQEPIMKSYTLYKYIGFALALIFLILMFKKWRQSNA